MSHDGVTTQAPTMREQIAHARDKQRAMRRAFKGIVTRQTAQNFDPEWRAWLTRSHHIDSQIAWATTRQVDRAALGKGGKKSRRLGALAQVSA